MIVAGVGGGDFLDILLPRDGGKKSIALISTQSLKIALTNARFHLRQIKLLEMKGEL